MTWQTLLQRKEFEKAYGEPISERTWYRYRDILLRGNALDTPNIQKLAELKKNLHELDLDSFEKFKNLNSEFNLEDSELILGKEFLNKIEKLYEIIIHRSTISKWFRVIGGYEPDKVYKFEDLKVIAVKAYNLAKSRFEIA
jgi:hypothetical protein